MTLLGFFSVFTQPGSRSDGRVSRNPPVALAKTGHWSSDHVATTTNGVTNLPLSNWRHALLASIPNTFVCFSLCSQWPRIIALGSRCPASFRDERVDLFAHATDQRSCGFSHRPLLRCRDHQRSRHNRIDDRLLANAPVSATAMKYSSCRSSIAGWDRSVGAGRGEFRIGLRVVAKTIR